MKTVLTVGVFDLLHLGHVELFRKAKALGDRLVVAVQDSESVEKYKPGCPTVNSTEARMYVVKAIKYVDEVRPQEDRDKFAAWQRIGFDVMFVGDDWKGTEKWNKIEADLKEVGAEVVYFPYTKGTSSTLINETLKKLRG